MLSRNLVIYGKNSSFLKQKLFGHCLTTNTIGADLAKTDINKYINGDFSSDKSQAIGVTVKRQFWDI